MKESLTRDVTRLEMCRTKFCCLGPSSFLFLIPISVLLKLISSRRREKYLRICSMVNRKKLLNTFIFTHSFKKWCCLRHNSLRNHWKFNKYLFLWFSVSVNFYFVGPDPSTRNYLFFGPAYFQVELISCFWADILL